jgi:hypothetical protein
MSDVAARSGFLDELSRLSGQQWIFRTTVPGATVVVLLAQAAAGPDPRVWFVVLAAALSLAVALIPASSAGLVLVLLLGGRWLVSVPEQVSGWLLVAAAGLAAIHVAATLAAYGPPSLVLDRSLLTLWARRSVLLGVATTLVWLVVRLAASRDLPGGGWLVGSGLVVLVAWAGYLHRRLT